MDEPTSPDLDELAAIVVPVMHGVYDDNAERHDPHVGDDMQTFAQLVYRNSWYQLEQAFQATEGWETGRPEGSLTLRQGDLRYHVYRCGSDEKAAATWRLTDGQASTTKLSIALANVEQLSLFGGEQQAETPATSVCRELVIIHAGNPDDGCCGVWVGAPKAVERAGESPWSWIEPLWEITRAEGLDADGGAAPQVRHDELDTPSIDISLADGDLDEPTIDLTFNEDGEGDSDTGTTGP